MLLEIGGGVFSRPFQLEAVDDPAAPVLLASGELTRREGAAGQLTVDFPERFAHRLKLTVIDDRNAPLAVFGLTAQGAARQVVFEGALAAPGPLRLYYGNADRGPPAPRYDLAARLPAEMGPVATRLALGPERDNPAYRPRPKPFSERSPWLVYVVLAAAGLVLGGDPGEPGAGVGRRRPGRRAGWRAAQSSRPCRQLARTRFRRLALRARRGHAGSELSRIYAATATEKHKLRRRLWR